MKGKQLSNELKFSFFPGWDSHLIMNEVCCLRYNHPYREEACQGPETTREVSDKLSLNEEFNIDYLHLI